MMMGPGAYVDRLEDASYLELIRERDDLIRFVVKFEKDEMAGDRSDPEWKYSPSPDVRYQVYLECLAALCTFMKEKYNEEYIWGNRRLQQDAEEQGGID